MKFYFASLVTACISILMACSDNQQKKPQGSTKTYQILTVKSHPATIYYEFPAVIEGQQVIEIRPKVDGYVQEIYVNEGATVKKGQLLFKISNPQYEQQVITANAAIKSAVADVNAAKMEAEYQFRYNFELTNSARTYFYPALTITAEVGLYNTVLNNYFNAAALFGNIVAGLTQPIFNRGLNRQRLQVSKAQQDEALITFRQTLLTAGEEVSNALCAYQAATDKLALRSQQIDYLVKAVDYTKELLKYTTNTNFTDVLTSEQSLLAAQLNHVNDKLQQLQAVVSLYRSLGGGWK